MKKFIFILFPFFFHTLSAQDLPLNTQIFMNPYFYNPAFAGYENRGAVFLGRRQQWTGIEGAPTTIFLNFSTNFAKTVVFRDLSRATTCWHTSLAREATLVW